MYGPSVPIWESENKNKNKNGHEEIQKKKKKKKVTEPVVSVSLSMHISSLGKSQNPKHLKIWEGRIK